MFINFIIAEGGLAPAYIAALIGFIVFGAKNNSGEMLLPASSLLYLQ